MNFIKAEFTARFRAIKLMLSWADERLERKEYLAFILYTLFSAICTVMGVVLLPITLIISYIVWRHDRAGCEEFVDDLLGDRNS